MRASSAPDEERDDGARRVAINYTIIIIIIIIIKIRIKNNHNKHNIDDDACDVGQNHDRPQTQTNRQATRTF